MQQTAYEMRISDWSSDVCSSDLGKPYRTIWLNDDGWSVEIIDQTLMPHRFETVTLRSLQAAARAIQAMQVRGAPLIGEIGSASGWERAWQHVYISVVAVSVQKQIHIQRVKAVLILTISPY